MLTEISKIQTEAVDDSLHVFDHKQNVFYLYK